MLTVAQLVAGLGGPSKVAEAFGVTGSAVSNWNIRGVPGEHAVKLWKMATAAGLDWAPPGAEDLALVAKERAA